MLKSWAILKGVPVEPGVRGLAVQVGDHLAAYFKRSTKGRYAMRAMLDCLRSGLASRLQVRVQCASITVLKGQTEDAFGSCCRFKLSR